jgi:predicted TIM-barrel fold metal-dependent hydrolase
VIVDVHTHAFPAPFIAARDRLLHDEPVFAELYAGPKAAMATGAEIVRALDEAEVDRALVAGFAWTDADRCRHHNDALLDLGVNSGGRLLALCCVPATDPDAAAREMERCAAAGARGFGELRLKHGAASLFDEATLDAIAGAAARLGLPLLIHASEPVGHRYPGKEGGPLDAIWRLREGHPSNVLVLAHLGGGLPFYASMREVGGAFEQGRTYVDTAAAAFLYRPGVYRRLAQTVGAGCLLFGSDFPLIRPARELDRLRGAGLEADDLAAILGGTACRLFRIEGG